MVCNGGVTLCSQIELQFLSRHLDVTTQVERQHVAFVWFALHPWLRVRIPSFHKTLEYICGSEKCQCQPSDVVNRCNGFYFGNSALNNSGQMSVFFQIATVITYCSNSGGIGGKMFRHKLADLSNGKLSNMLHRFLIRFMNSQH